MHTFQHCNGTVRTYRGFDKRIESTDQIAMIVFEGDLIDVWAIDDYSSLSALRDYYRDVHGWELGVIHIFKKGVADA